MTESVQLTDHSFPSNESKEIMNSRNNQLFQTRMFKAECRKHNAQSRIFRAEFSKQNVQSIIFRAEYSRPNSQSRIFRPDISDQIFQSRFSGRSFRADLSDMSHHMTWHDMLLAVPHLTCQEFQQQTHCITRAAIVDACPGCFLADQRADCSFRISESRLLFQRADCCFR